MADPRRPARSSPWWRRPAVTTSRPLWTPAPPMRPRPRLPLLRLRPTPPRLRPTPLRLRRLRLRPTAAEAAAEAEAAQAEADAAAARAAEAEAALAEAMAEGEGAVDPEVVAELEAQMAEAMAEADAAAARAAEAEAAMEATMMEMEMSLAGSVVTILGPETGSEAEGFLAGFEPLRERTGIVVRYSGTRDATTELNLAVEAGDPPDIVIIPQPGRIKQFGDSGDAVALPQDDTRQDQRLLRPVLVRPGHLRRQRVRRAQQGRREEPGVVQPAGLRRQRLRDPPDLGRTRGAHGADEEPTATPRGVSASNREPPPAGPSPTGWRT